MKLNKEKIEKLVKDFDIEFNTREKERIKKFPVIMSVYEQFYDEIFNCDENYKRIKNTQDMILTKLKLNDEQNKLLEGWQECEDIVLSDIAERAFIYGICIKEEMNSEISKFNNTDIE